MNLSNMQIYVLAYTSHGDQGWMYLMTAPREMATGKPQDNQTRNSFCLSVRKILSISAAPTYT